MENWMVEWMGVQNISSVHLGGWCPPLRRTKSNISETQHDPCYDGIWPGEPLPHLAPSSSVWSQEWLSFQNSLNIRLLPSLHTLQPCETKSFISKSKIFTRHILKAKVLHHWALPRRGQAFALPMTRMRTCQMKLQTINLNKWNSLQRELKDSLRCQRQTSL